MSFSNDGGVDVTILVVGMSMKPMTIVQVDTVYGFCYGKITVIVVNMVARVEKQRGITFWTTEV